MEGVNSSSIFYFQEVVCISISGVYQIINKSNNKKYVGSSKDIGHRWYRHKLALRNNKHYNDHLQRAWNKYGEVSFVFKVLEVVEDKSKLLEIEQYWLDKLETYKSKNGYNTCIVAGSIAGIKLSEETKKLIGQRSRERNAVKAILGMKREGEKHGNALLSNYEVKLIKLLFRDTDLRNMEISTLFNVTKDYICELRENKKWKSVVVTYQDVLPEELLVKVIELKEIREKSLKLSTLDVKCIKLMFRDTNISIAHITRLFNVSRGYIDSIIKNKKRNDIKVYPEESIEDFYQYLLAKGIDILKECNYITR
jgi:group I intron endonuclease